MCTLSTQQFCYTLLAHSLQNYVVTVHQKVGNGTIVVTETIYYLHDRSVANMFAYSTTTWLLGDSLHSYSYHHHISLLYIYPTATTLARIKTVIHLLNRGVVRNVSVTKIIWISKKSIIMTSLDFVMRKHEYL